VLAVDVSPWLRSDAPTSADRLFCHVYGRGRGQAQMIPGWPYSFVAALEPGQTSWVALLDAVRLGPADDATAVTAAQLRAVVTRLITARACLLTHRALMLHSGLMVRAGVISDELWALLEPVLPGVAGRPGRPWNDHRRTSEGIVWRFRTGSPWRDLPSEFGVYQSVWERHRRWSTDGTYNTMFAAVKANATDQDRQLMGTISVDSTSIRAHQHAAGARFHDHTGGRIE